MKQNEAFKVFFNHTCNAGVVFYRMINFINYMKRKNTSVAYSKFNPDSQEIANWEVCLNYPEYAEANGFNLNKICDDMDMLMDISDISVWQICHTGKSYALFRLYRDKYDKRKPILTEVDDYVFGLNPENQGSQSYYPNSDAEYFAEQQIRNSNLIIASTPWLKEGDGVSPGLSKFNSCVEVIPNCIDFDKWDKLYNSKRKGRIRIGWAGSHAHYNDLKVLKDVVKHTTQKYKNVEFMFFGGMPDYIKSGPQVKFYNRWYSIDNYPKELAGLGFDIGLAPLRDNLFNRAKSNLRWLEYSALKVPTIASPRVPFNGLSNIMRAEEVDEWISNLEKLIENEDLRVDLGSKAYEEVKRDFNVEIWAGKYLDLLNEIVDGKRKVNVARYDEQGNPFVIK